LFFPLSLKKFYPSTWFRYKRYLWGFTFDFVDPLTPALSHKGRGSLFFSPPLMGGEEGEGACKLIISNVKAPPADIL